ncbi:hypothetical protein CRM22_006515 [Opisthorchis felineus]|uniref:Uncharacterized protein n=1 Tax=Opisthorchis felineus TaxID=147828 RepID=A0A4S2LKN3_OPIFE|nr:hypothetical protein CRM22_006515 [Opisthorchis felineus]
MQSTGRESIRASKKRRHSHGLDGTPVSEKTKELFHTVSRNATISRNLKRVREGDDEEASNTENAVLQSPGSATIKRPRKKPSLLGSSALQKYEGTCTSTTEITSQPGQKVALLSMIRQRLAELNNRTLYVRKLPRNTSLAQLKALCPTSINARLPTKAFSNRRRFHRAMGRFDRKIAGTNLFGDCWVSEARKTSQYFTRPTADENMMSKASICAHYHAYRRRHTG